MPTKNTKTNSSTKSQKTEKAPAGAKQNRSIFPVCIFCCLASAIIVVLIFACGLIPISNRTNYRYASSNGAFEKVTEADASGFRVLDSAAVVDMIALSNGQGIVLIAPPANCLCDTLETSVRTAAANINADRPLYRYTLTESDERVDTVARSLLLNGRSLDEPTLVYIENGVVYDRLDDIQSEADIASFVAKYL